jgi:hypothetical protein
LFAGSVFAVTLEEPIYAEDQAQNFSNLEDRLVARVDARIAQAQTDLESQKQLFFEQFNQEVSRFKADFNPFYFYAPIILSLAVFSLFFFKQIRDLKKEIIKLRSENEPVKHKIGQPLLKTDVKGWN